MNPRLAQTLYDIFGWGVVLLTAFAYYRMGRRPRVA